MNLRFSHFALFSCVLLFSCSHKNFEKIDNGIVVNIPQKSELDVNKVKLEVLGDKLIKVSATPEDKFSDRKSLICSLVGENIPFSVEENDSLVSLATSQIKASVNKTTGQVKFFDKEGNPILVENNGGGKEFTPIEVEGKKGYTIRQLFESPADEAFYGLGQHQSDEFNYKGKNEELYQYNTKVAVPFIVSNKNYGLLWDSYSLSRFGNPEEYSQLYKVFNLYDKKGEKGALTGTYKYKSGDVIERREDSLYYADLKTIKNLPDKYPLYTSTVTYEGDLEALESGNHKFILYYAGYTKLYVDNKLVVPEIWRTAWNPNSYKFNIDMEKGKRVSFKIEWIPDGGQSYCALRALSPVAESEQNKQSWWSEMNPQIDYYFVYGKNMDEVISGYRTLTGKAPVMPKWAMGFWQSRERYKTQEELLTNLTEFRKRNIPIDNIVLDWSYWPEDAWGSHEFDKNRFPNPKAMVDSVHSLNANIMISVWPKFYYTTEHYKDLDKNGWMYRKAVNDSIRDWIGKGYIGSFYDAYSEGARKMFWAQMKEHLYSLGIDAWWMDASEPDICSNSDMQERKALSGPTALGPSTEYFNTYALMNADAIYKGQRETDNNKRVFLLTRSGFAGLQKYSTATWSGDIATRWEDMKAQISAGLNFAISGIPYWTMDIGGFCVEKRYENGQREYDKTMKENADYKEWRELNTRWYQFGAFCPLYRAHGQFPYREIWNIAPESHPAYKSMVYYTKLRYNMMPYIYSLAGMTYLNDYTIMRPLIMDFTSDSNVNNIGDQYMFGPSLMVCPVYKYEARSRKIYLPEGETWYDFYSGKVVKGGSQNVEAPYERIPLFVRAGAIMPYGPDMQYSTEKPADNITIYVYDGKDGDFTLYEDEAVNYNYEKGNYSTINFKYNSKNKTFTIGERKGKFNGMLNNRKFNIILVSGEKVRPFDLNAKGVNVDYNGKQTSVNL